MPSFRQSLPMMLNYTLDAIMPAYREVFSRHDLTEQQWRILRVLWTANSINAAELSKRTLLHKPSLVGILDRLERKGLVARIRSKTDRRQIQITTTPQGRELAAAVLPQAEHVHEHLKTLVSADEWAALEKTLNKFIQSTTINPRGD